MNPQDKLVFEKIARKDLSFGLLVKHRDFMMQKVIGINPNRHKNHFPEENAVLLVDASYPYYHEAICSQYFNKEFPKECQYEIIGHPIVLSDVLNYLDKSDEDESGYHFVMVTGMWKYDRPFYEDQSEECKEYIRNLVK